MDRIVLLFTSLIVIATFTTCAYWFELNGQATIEILNRLPILFLPASYVYMLWIVIFVSLFVWMINYYKNRHTPLRVSTLQTALFVCISVLQVATLFTWHSELYIASITFLALQLLSMFGLYMTYPLNREGIHLRMPIAALLSWSLMLFLVFIRYIHVFFEWPDFGFSNALWAVIIMTIGTAFALHLRYHHFDIISPLVFIWSYIGIIIAYGFEELLVSTAAFFLCGVMIVGIIFMKKTHLALK
ncbi:hypothetical protein [Solibacillus sp. FSL H8-0538]|uniref:hypothetical protein n=1 Tax=Solibacillus sp. FSL H8-0538 TaxID=2921400 RepID=UPI0030F60252